jgi:hypothetical protein
MLGLSTRVMYSNGLHSLALIGVGFGLSPGFGRNSTQAVPSVPLLLLLLLLLLTGIVKSGCCLCSKSPVN